ncbi:MAG: sulfite exporter TauE/SafE family protein [Gammaproteobacteria bacterium]|nr:sulfite exporter TauE/SafE family protein [Gammaproteobacteria bacterium]
MVEIVPLLLLGVFSGFIAGLLGVGGGLIIVPALLYLLAGDIEQSMLMHSAIGTALAVIIFTSLSSVWAHHRHGAIYWRYFIKLMPSILLGAFSGAIITQYLSFDFLRIFFAIFEVTVALMMWFGISTSGHADNLSRWVWLITGYLIGLISAIVGIGGGTMSTPFLTYNKVDIKNAIATSAAIGLPIAIAGSIGFIVVGWRLNTTSGLGFIHTEALLSISIMSVLFAPLGAKIAHSVDSKRLKKFFALFLLLLGVWVLNF